MMRRRSILGILVVVLMLFSTIAPSISSASFINKKSRHSLNLFKFFSEKNRGFFPRFNFLRDIFSRFSKNTNRGNSNRNDGNGNYPKGTLDGDNASLPAWGPGYYWKYDMVFGFVLKGVAEMKNGHVKNMRAEVVKVENGNYYLQLTSDGIEGKLTVKDMVSATLKGSFGGKAVIDKRTLGMKKFEFDISGTLGGFKLDVEFSMDIDRGVLNFLEFPLEKGKTWDINCHAVYNAKVVLGAFRYSKTDKGDFNDNMRCVDFKKINDYKSFVVSGELGNPSEICYSPEVGFLTKVNEVLPNWGGLEAIFKLDLLETNYMGRKNNPPEKPTVSGPDKGKTGNSYTFIAKSTDPDGDKIKYVFDWGDLQTTETDYVNSGEEVKKSHYWKYPGLYEVTVRAVDIMGAESILSDPIYINIEGKEIKETRNVTVVVHKIKALDSIESVLQLGADWSYKVYFYDGEKWLTRTHDCPSQHNTVTIDKKYRFQVTTGNPKIKIKVWERDKTLKIPFKGILLDYNDLADISGHVGGGKDNDISDERGAIYNGIYNLAKHSMKEKVSDDNDYVKEKDGYIITSGDFPPDSSTKKDENDAMVWLKITDDYDPEVKITKPASGNYYYTGEYIEFDAKIKGSIPPYKWKWIFGDGNFSYEKSTTYRYSQPGDYFVKVVVEDGAGKTIESDPIIVHVFRNTPPWRPERPSGPTLVKVGKEYTYTTMAIDPDTVPYVQKIQYGWDWNDDNIVDEWTGFYTSGVQCSVTHVWESTGTKKIKVKARDEFGLESDWSDYLPVVVPYIKEKYSPTAVAESNKNRITKDNSVVTFISEKSYDNDDNKREIKWIRWDFDGDGKWDTGSRVTNHWVRFRGNERITVDFSYLFNDNNGHVSSLASHQNSVKSKTYFAKLEVKDDEGDTDIDYVQMTIVYSSYEDKKPVAVAKVWPAKITRDHAILYFDSSKSRDNDQAGKEITKIRWDFDGDGKWDTGRHHNDHWISFKGNENISVDLSYIYDNLVSSLGLFSQHSSRSKTYYAKLEVEDNEGSKDIDYVMITIYY